MLTINIVSQLSPQIDGRLRFHFTAFLHAPQGHLRALGPGFVSISKAFANNKIKMYLLTDLLLFTFSWLTITPVVWVNLHVCKCESRSAVLLVYISSWLIMLKTIDNTRKV